MHLHVSFQVLKKKNEMEDSNGVGRQRKHEACGNQASICFKDSPCLHEDMVPLNLLSPSSPSTGSRPAPCSHAPTKFLLKKRIPWRRDQQCISHGRSSSLFASNSWSSNLNMNLIENALMVELINAWMPTYGAGLVLILSFWLPK